MSKKKSKNPKKMKIHFLNVLKTYVNRLKDMIINWNR